MWQPKLVVHAGRKGTVCAMIKTQVVLAYAANMRKLWNKCLPQVRDEDGAVNVQASSAGSKPHGHSWQHLLMIMRSGQVEIGLLSLLLIWQCLLLIWQCCGDARPLANHLAASGWEKYVWQVAGPHNACLTWCAACLQHV